jgi:hypothetical protein
MKTLFKLLVAVAVLNACVRCAIVAAHYYQFKDDAQHLVTFGGSVAPNTLHDEIVEKAMALALPVQPENVDVQRDGVHTTATVKYSQPVEVFPRYRFPVDFAFTVEGLAESRADVPTP